MFHTARPRRLALLSGGAAAALLASPALADVTADDIWAAFQRSAAATGQGLASDGEAREGNVLTVRNVTFTVPIEEGGEARLAMGDLRFTEQGDGTVAIALAPVLTLHIASRPPAGEAVDAVMALRHEGLEIVASGSADEISYHYVADAVTFGVERFEVDGTPAEVVMDLAAEGLEGHYTTTLGEVLSVDSGIFIERLAADLRIAPPDETGRLALSATIEGVETSGTAARLDLLPQIEGGDLPAAVAAGFAITTGFGYGATSFRMEFAEAGETVEIEGAAESGEAGGELSAERVSYYLGGYGASYRMRGGGLPLPEVALSFDELRLDFDLPAGAGTEPKDFSLLARLVDLAVDPGLWSLVDPEATLPRDPATLIVDLGGRLAWPQGLFAIDTMGADGFPGFLDAVQLRELRARIAGAEITGEGAFIFDNADRTTFPGMPRPMGEVHLRATGVVGLMDRLVALGVVPAEEADTLRFFLGLFARQVEGEDEYTSTVEITPEGGILANGQALQ